MTRLRVLLFRLRALVHARQLDREMHDELASHLAEAADEYVRQGLSPDEARLAALRSFGGVIQTVEVHRDMRTFAWLDDLRQDLRYTARALVKNPAFALVAIGTLALGIGANTAIFTLLDAVMFKPLPVPAPGELFTFYESGPEGTADPTGGTGRFLRFSYPRFERLQEALGTRGSLAAVTRSSRFVFRRPGDAQPQFLQAQLVSGGYFGTLGVSAAQGRLLTPDDVRVDRVSPVTVISDSFWKRKLDGTDAAIGQTLVINGVDVTIVGVAPPGFFGMWSDSEADLWLPLTLQAALHYNNNTSSYGRADGDAPWHGQDLVSWLNLVARVPAAERTAVAALLPAANRLGIADLASQIENPKERHSIEAHTLMMEPFAHGFSGLRSRYADALFALTAMVALVLVVTCANIANLLLARGAAHAREIGIRVSLGASASRLVRQCLTESLTLAVLGGTAGLLLGNWASTLLARQVLGTSGRLPSVFSPDARVLAFAASLSLVTAIVFGLVPALRAVSAGRTAVPGANQRQAIGQAGMRSMRSLVAAQLALSLVVVFAAMLLGRTLMNFMRIDPGFTADRLVTVSFDSIVSGYKADDMPGLSRRLIEAARSVPGVTSASVSRCGLIAGCSSSGSFRIDGAGTGLPLYRNGISPGYFATAGIPLVAGREFTDRDTAHGARVAIVNESIVRRYFPGRNPIGQRMGSGQLDTEIVGVVRDAHTQSLHEPPVPMVYFPIEQSIGSLQSGALTNMDVRVGGDVSSAATALREAIRRAEPDLLFDGVSPMSQRLARDLNRERIVAYLAFSFGGLTLLLAALGLYGVLSYGVARRTQEIGVRMALGARRAEVMGLVLGQSARLPVAGIVLGLIGTAAGARYLAGMLFGVTPLDPWTFVAVALTFAVVATVASYVPARRAASVDPLVALRCE